MLSRDLKSGPRNHAVDTLAGDFGHIADDMHRLSATLSGRSALLPLDLAAVETFISRAHAALDRASTALVYARPALTTRGAGNAFMARHAAAPVAMGA